MDNQRHIEEQAERIVMRFVNYEVRPCIEANDGVTSFQDKEEFEREMTGLALCRIPYETFWTLYGLHYEDADEHGELYPVAIGDFKDEQAAREIMNALTWRIS